MHEGDRPAEAVDVVNVIAEDTCCQTILRFVSTLQHLNTQAGFPEMLYCGTRSCLLSILQEAGDEARDEAGDEAGDKLGMKLGMKLG